MFQNSFSLIYNSDNTQEKETMIFQLQNIGNIIYVRWVIIRLIIRFFMLFRKFISICLETFEVTIDIINY